MTVSLKSNSELYVVGVGASVGGLDALTKLLKNFNGIETGFCVVIAMQFSPDFESELPSILNKYCKWPVLVAHHNANLLSHKIYVAPRNCNIHIVENTIKLIPLNTKRSAAPSIDEFFNSLAEAKKNRAIGIILSGSGRDGSDGIKSIKKQKGFTLAQSLNTAQHSSMPKAAIETNSIDATIPTEQMFEVIKNFINNSYIIANGEPKEKNVDAIFEMLEKRSGTDFTLYKPATIMRRIHLRMDSLSMNSIDKYYKKLKEAPHELDLLFDTVLIGVTEFFRDVESFKDLQEQINQLLLNKKPGQSIRIWSVGCATGEEAYSICILLHEILGPSLGDYHIQIFASDLNERALLHARKGIYSLASIQNLPNDYISKYFTKSINEQYEVNKNIKQLILFSRHDISNDPPFVRLDIILCRNLLIYFNNKLQKETLQVFHYALRPNGILFLGKSESVSVASELFIKSGKNKIFKKTASVLGYHLKFSRFGKKDNFSGLKKNSKEIRAMSIIDIAKETLYYKFEHPFVIISEQAEIKEVHGSLRLYIEISQGTMNANLFKMANTELITVLKALHTKVKRTGIQHSSPVIKFNLYENDHYVKIKIAPLIYTITDLQFYMVIFETIIPSDRELEFQKTLATTDFTDMRIKELEEELSSNRELLNILTEELESLNEELQSSNEELQSSNEELKSSNEELETSNEELQSSNEELNTANNELRFTNESLIEKESALIISKGETEQNEMIYRMIAENIPNGTVGILNSDFEIQYLGGKGLDKFNVDPKTIIGKNLPSLNTSETERKKLIEVFSNTLKGKNGSIEFAFGENYFHLQTTLLNTDNDSNNIMYLTQNVTEQRKKEIKLNIAIQTADLIIYDWIANIDQFENNPSLNKFLGYDPNMILTGKMYMDRIHTESHNEISSLYEKSQITGILEYEARMVVDNSIKWIRVLGKVLFDENNKPERVVATLMNITKDKQLLQNLQASEEKFRDIADSAPVMIWLSTTNKSCTYLNRKWYEFTGGKPEDCLGDGWVNAIHPDDRATVQNTYDTSFDERVKFTIEYRIKRYDGKYSWFLIHGQPIIQGDDYFEGFIGSCIDINEQKEFRNKLEDLVKQRTKELEKSNAELLKVNVNLEEYAYVASHDLQEPIRKIRTFNSIINQQITDTETLDYSNKIEQSARHMTSLVQNILDYSRLSESSFDKEPLDLTDIMDYIKDDLELMINDKHAKISYKNLGSVMGIEIQLHQLFGNIILNSLKFTEDIPQINITSQLLSGQSLLNQFRADTDKDYMMVAIKDNGIGIKAEFVDQIFKPFKRLNSKNKYSGTGIGLSISLRIAELHKGFIAVESDNELGSTFKVYLPTT